MRKAIATMIIIFGSYAFFWALIKLFDKIFGKVVVLLFFFLFISGYCSATDYVENLQDNVYMSYDGMSSSPTTGGVAYVDEITARISIAESIQKAFTREISEYITISERLRTFAPLKLSDTISMSDTITLTVTEILYLRGFLSILELLRGEIE